MNPAGPFGSRRRALAAAAAGALLTVVLSGCALIDRMSGVAEARSLQESGVQASARILQIWDTGITANDDPVIGMQVEVDRPDGTHYSATIQKSLISRLDIPRF